MKAEAVWIVEQILRVLLANRTGKKTEELLLNCLSFF